MKTLEVIAKDEIFTISDDETMDIKHLNKYIAKHQQLNGSRYKKLKDGYSYVIFPEGSRSEDGNVGEFKKGSFKLATDSGVRIIPVTLVGTYNIQSKKSLKISPNKNVKIVVDKPITLDKLSSEEQKNINLIVNEIIKNNLEKYRKN